MLSDIQRKESDMDRIAVVFVGLSANMARATVVARQTVRETQEILDMVDVF